MFIRTLKRSFAGLILILATLVYPMVASATGIPILPPELQALVNQHIPVYYVSESTGSDSNSGLSWQDPLKTINHAVSIAPVGSGIFVESGVYLESSPVVVYGNKGTTISISKGLTIIGQDINNTIIECNSTNIPNGSGVSSIDSAVVSIENSEGGNLLFKNFTVDLDTTAVGHIFTTWWGPNCTLSNIVVNDENNNYDVFYLNGSGLAATNFTVVAHPNYLIYSNGPSMTFNNSISTTPFTVGECGGSTESNSYFSVNSNIFTNYAAGDFSIASQYASTYQGVGAYWGAYYADYASSNATLYGSIQNGNSTVGLEWNVFGNPSDCQVIVNGSDVADLSGTANSYGLSSSQLANGDNIVYINEVGGNVSKTTAIDIYKVSPSDIYTLTAYNADNSGFVCATAGGVIKKYFNHVGQSLILYPQSNQIICSSTGA